MEGRNLWRHQYDPSFFLFLFLCPSPSLPFLLAPFLKFFRLSSFEKHDTSIELSPSFLNVPKRDFSNETVQTRTFLICFRSPLSFRPLKNIKPTSRRRRWFATTSLEKKEKPAFLSFPPSLWLVSSPFSLESRLRNRRACILFLEQLDPVDLFQKVRVVRQKKLRGTINAFPLKA